MEKNLQLEQRRKVVRLLGILTLLFGLAMPDRLSMLINYWTVLTSPAHLITDIFATGGLAAAFLNASLHLFVADYLLGRNNRSNISGLQMAVLGIFLGHSFFGTNLFNIIPLIAGVFLYAKWTFQSFKLYTTISLFATSLSPVVSYLAFANGGSPQSILIAIGVGLVLGFIAPPLAEEFLKFHHGLTLYNFGFTTGIIGMFLLLFFPYFGIEVARDNQLSQGYQLYILLYLLMIMAVLAVFVVKNFRTALESLPKILQSSGRVPDDFVSKFGLEATLLNMLVTVAGFLLILLICGVELNGPLLGGLLTVFGFAAFGKHLKNALSIGLGIMGAALLQGHELSGFRFGFTLLMATGLSPIAGTFGIGYGIVAGFLHYNLSSVVIYLHQGLSLYNNGFSTGFVAAFLVPLIEVFQEYRGHRERLLNLLIRKKD